MKTRENEVRSLNDLIFEHRNHEYGAYAIRKSYPDNVNKAMGAAIGFAMVIAIFSLIRPGKQTDRIIPEIPPGINLDKKEVIILRDEPPRAQQQVRKVSKQLPPVAVAQPDRPIIEQPHLDFVAGSETGLETGNADIEYTIGTGEVPEVISSTPGPPKVWDRSEIMPSYKGGMEGMMRFIVSKTRYPAVARRIQTEGTVFVSFIIGTGGEILDAKIVMGVSRECDAEALRVVTSMPAWNPGMQGGLPVMVRMVVPIKFKLQPQ